MLATHNTGYDAYRAPAFDPHVHSNARCRRALLASATWLICLRDPAGRSLATSATMINSSGEVRTELLPAGSSISYESGSTAGTVSSLRHRDNQFIMSPLMEHDLSGRRM